MKIQFEMQSLTTLGNIAALDLEYILLLIPWTDDHSVALRPKNLSPHFSPRT